MKQAVVWLGFASALISATPAFSQSGPAPCRQGALALIAMLDQGDESSADYRHAYGGVVQSCGPSPRRASVFADRKACRDLALKMLDEIEDGRLQSPGFARARDVFAASCAPR